MFIIPSHGCHYQCHKPSKFQDICIHHSHAGVSVSNLRGASNSSMIIWLVFKKRKALWIRYGFRWFYHVNQQFYMVLFGFIWFYMVLYGFIWFYHVTSNIKPTVHQGKFLPTSPTSRELVPGHILPSSQDGS